MLPRRCHRFLSTTTTLTAVSGQDVAFFESLLGQKHVLQQDLDKFNVDWTRQFRGQSSLVLQPTSTEEVSAVLKYCNEKSIAVVPQGGNTGLVGGSIPIAKEVILSLARMNKILDLDLDAQVIKLEAGVVLENAEQHCRAQELTMPLDLGSKGSCQLGGNLSTNAGGIRLVRFGSLRSNCLGLTAVTANGNVLRSMRALRKDNAGYDLKQLFIGSEGTLGVITEAAIMVHKLPKFNRVVLFGVQQFDDCITLLRRAKQVLGQSLSAFEYFSSPCLFAQPKPLGEDASKFYVLLELIAFNEEEDALAMEKLEKVLNTCPNLGAVLSQSEKQYRELWNLRELITTRLRATPTTHVFKYDVSIPSILFDECTTLVQSRVAEKHPKLKVFQYGHLGDGNLHFNATIDLEGSEKADAASQAKRIQHDVEEELYGFVQKHHGSISAEHGLGQLKASKILKSRSASEVAWMRQIKTALDPNGILNPGKVLPQV